MRMSVGKRKLCGGPKAIFLKVKDGGLKILQSISLKSSILRVKKSPKTYVKKKK